MYHEITDTSGFEEMSRETQYSYVIDTEKFEKQICFLKNNNFRTLSFYELVALTSGKKPRHQEDNERAVVLSFDDGFIGNYENVFPLLVENGFIGNFFLITSKIGKGHMMNWEQVREMQKYGMCFGSHTVNHLMLGMLGRTEIFHELDYSRKTIEDKTGIKIEHLTLPHGSYNNIYKPAALDAGYIGGATSDPGVNTGSTDPFYLKRMVVPRKASLQYFTFLCERKKSIYYKHFIKKQITKTAKKIVGESRYLTLYNKFFGVNE